MRSIHELSVIKEVLVVVLKNAEDNKAQKVTGVTLRIGELRDLVDEWVQRYWNYSSKGTIAEGASINIIKIPVKCMCKDCGEIYSVDVHKVKELCCPNCSGSKASLISGKEFYIEGIEIL